MAEAVNHPAHYNGHPSGVECIEIVEHMGFNLGNAFKYGWRYTSKGDPTENLQKMVWYLDREIARQREHGYSDWLHSDPGARNSFEEVMSTRKAIFNRPSPWCESVRHALAAICEYHRTSSESERWRLLDKAKRCVAQAIDDEGCARWGSGLAI